MSYEVWCGKITLWFTFVYVCICVCVPTREVWQVSFTLRVLFTVTINMCLCLRSVLRV